MPNLPIHYRRMLQLALLLVLGVVSTSVLAQDAHGQLVTSLVDLFTKGNTSWAAKIQASAGQLFWSLALISVVWNFGALLLRRADISEFFFEILSFIFFTGLFYWFLTNTFIGNGNSDDLVNAIVNSFKQMAPDGVGDLRQSADNIIQIGLNIYYQVLKQSGSQNWTDGDLLLVGITVLLIVIALSMVVAQIALVLIMAWMLAYGGIFLLGFGGARWTSLIAISYLKHVVAVGVALLALNLLVYFGRDILDQLSSGLTGGDAVQYEQLADMLVVSLIMMVLAYKVPSLLYSLVTSSPLGLMTGTASMTSNAVAAGSRAVYNTAYNTAAQAISHYRSSETTYHRQAGEPESIRAQHVTVIDALRDAAGIQAGTEAVYKPVDVSGSSGSRADDDSSPGKEEGSVFGENTPPAAWPGERPSQASPFVQAASSAQSGDGGKGGSGAIDKGTSTAIGATASSQEQASGSVGQGGSAFGSAPGPSFTSSGGGGMGVGAGGPVTATVSGGGGGGGFQPPTVNATVSASPSNSLSSPNLLGGSGTSGSVGGAVSKAAAGLQDGPSLGAAPRQSSRKIDDTTGPVGRRDKQQERALKEQEKTARQEPERRKDDKEKTRENTKPVPATDSKPSSPTDDEVNAFRDRRPDADFNQDDADR
jgi:P-type conjugative transfer protein TrbL